jgi:hypothetical protein
MMKEVEVGMIQRGISNSSSDGDGEDNIGTMRDVARGMLEETYRKRMDFCGFSQRRAKGGLELDK